MQIYKRNGEETFFIRLGWKSKKAEERKALEKQFANYLKNGEKGIVYSEVKNKGGVQILKGKKDKDRMGLYLYITRKRFGNNSELQCELYTKTEDDSNFEKLEKFIGKVK